jgi:hypothetical protein
MNIYLSLVSYFTLLTIISLTLGSLFNTNNVKTKILSLLVMTSSKLTVVLLLVSVFYAPTLTVYNLCVNCTSSLQLTIPTFTISSLYTAESLFYISMILHALFFYIFAFSTIVTFLYTTFDFTLLKIVIRVFFNYLLRTFITRLLR